MYEALYGPEGLVIFDHPYNADYGRLITAPLVGLAVPKIVLLWRSLCSGSLRGPTFSIRCYSKRLVSRTGISGYRLLAA